MSPWLRRGLGIGAAAAVVVVSVVAARSWRNYMYLDALGNVPMAIGVAVVLLFVSLGLFQVRWRIPVYLIAGPPALGVFAFGILFPFRPFITTSSFVNEAASMGSYSIVRFHRHWLRPSQIELRVRTHDGLFSRDGEPIACFSGDQLSDPKWTLGGVRFIDEDTIEVSARNGDVMLLDIDAETLTARSGALDRCTNADYPTWDD